MRHGQTRLNRERVIQGITDEPLSDTGRQQAREAGAEFADRCLVFDRVYSSPLSRAMETGMIVSGKGMEELIPDDRLAEMSFGIYEGIPVDEVIEELRPMFRDPLGYEGLESVEPVMKLVKRTGDFLQELAQEQPGENILVTAHGGVMRAMSVYLGITDIRHFWEKITGNCAYMILERQEDGSLKLIEKNDRVENAVRNTGLRKL